MEILQDINNEKIIRGARLNAWVFLLAIPMFGLTVVPFAYYHGISTTIHEINHLISYKFILLMLVGILVHELLHGLTWMVVVKKGYKSIRFGFNVNSFSPYTHCNEPMKVWQYRLGGAMPGLLMGAVPIIFSFIFNQTRLNFTGFLFLWAAGGDIISLVMLRKLNANTKVLDHPDEMGSIVVED